MKFGLHYSRFFVSEWRDNYVDFNGLKCSIKALNQTSSTQSTETPAQLSSIVARLESDAGICVAFEKQVLAWVINDEKQVWRSLGLCSIPSSLLCGNYGDVYELKYLQAAYRKLLVELNRIHWYARVNQKAVSKLFTKLERLSHGDVVSQIFRHWNASQVLFEQSWLETHGRIDGFLVHFTEILSTPPNGLGSLVARLLEESEDTAFQKGVYALLKTDNDNELATMIKAPNLAHMNKTAVYATLLKSAVVLRARKTAKFVLASLLVSDEEAIAESCFLALNLNSDCSRESEAQMQAQSNEIFNLLPLELFQSSETNIQGILQQRDLSGRQVLHFAAENGLKTFIEWILSSALIHEERKLLRELVLSRDARNKTPLHYAAAGGHTAAFKSLMSVMEDAIDVVEANDNLRNILGQLLVLCLEDGKSYMSSTLLTYLPDLTYSTKMGETALYCAARAGNAHLIKHLLKQQPELNLDRDDDMISWSPLMVACAHGHKEAIESLLAAGANPEARDKLGWTALEHAIFRGHHHIEPLFKLLRPDYQYQDGPAASLRSSYRVQPPLCKAEEKLVIVNLGRTQGANTAPSVTVKDYNVQFPDAFTETVTFELEFTAIGTADPSKLVQLPILDDELFQPYIFRIKPNEEPQLVVKLYKRKSAATRSLIGSGIVVLEQTDAPLGLKYDHLVRELTVSLLDSTAMDPAGTVVITYLVVSPYSGLEQSKTKTYSPTNRSELQLVGHRGFGQNIVDKSMLQLGENTITSFLAAAKSGASFVEFDLQVTRDGGAVIYHDFSFSESGTDVPIHELTLTQYKHIGSQQEPRHAPTAAAYAQRQRSWSSGEESQSRASDLQDRLRYTVDFESKGFKPNSRGDFIQNPLTTFDEILTELPQNIGFNIEIKYPRLHEANDAGVPPVALNMNTFVDVALDKIDRLAGPRPIILSSFTPEVCILLAVKQGRYPVLFITNAGKIPMTDRELRAASLQSAMRFARQWGLAGIVLACETFLYCPRLVKLVKNAGLICASYGLLNNDIENAQLQKEAGVDILMVDKIGIIASKLAG